MARSIEASDGDPAWCAPTPSPWPPAGAPARAAATAASTRAAYSGSEPRAAAWETVGARGGGGRAGAQAARPQAARQRRGQQWPRQRPPGLHQGGPLTKQGVGRRVGDEARARPFGNGSEVWRQAQTRVEGSRLWRRAGGGRWLRRPRSALLKPRRAPCLSRPQRRAPVACPPPFAPAHRRYRWKVRCPSWRAAPAGTPAPAWAPARPPPPRLGRGRRPSALGRARASGGAPQQPRAAGPAGRLRCRTRVPLLRLWGGACEAKVSGAASAAQQAWPNAEERTPGGGGARAPAKTTKTAVARMRGSISHLMLQGAQSPAQITSGSTDWPRPQISKPLCTREPECKTIRNATHARMRGRATDQPQWPTLGAMAAGGRRQLPMPQLQRERRPQWGPLTPRPQPPLLGPTRVVPLASPPLGAPLFSVVLQRNLQMHGATVGPVGAAAAGPRKR
jgi:hypothetical protein